MKRRLFLALPVCLGLVLSAAPLGVAQDPEALPEIEIFPGTDPLDWEGDLAERMVGTVDAFLLEQWQQRRNERAAIWTDAIKSDGYPEFLAARRAELRQRLGLRDEPAGGSQPRFLHPIGGEEVIAAAENWQARYITWPAFGNVEAQGILVEPIDRDLRGQIIAVPDADTPPEDWVWTQSGDGLQPALAARLAQLGYRVVVPVLVNRSLEKRNGRANLTNREFVYRPSFELGRHLIGFEVQELLTARKWLAEWDSDLPVGLIGYGEGGHLALFAAALDEGFDATLISGHFSTQQDLWNQPLDRNVFGRMKHFGDAELAWMIQPRRLIIEAARGPEVVLPSEGGGPAHLKSPELNDVNLEYQRLFSYGRAAGLKPTFTLSVIGGGEGDPLASGPMLDLLESLGGASKVDALASATLAVNTEVVLDNDQRQEALVNAMIDHTQKLLVESPYVRASFMQDLDTSSLDAFEKSSRSYRETFRHRIVGHVGQPLKSGATRNVRSRQAYQGRGWTGYDVVLDVYDDVFAYGVLLWPDGIETDEKRPVVVCQHGLEGRPQDVIQGDHGAYHDFAAKLAEQGYIVFAPQNIYIFQDRFRTLQRKANPLELTLFSIMVDQHQQITDWLGSLSQVDSERIAFYGLSYGGKSAMRIPALVENYCLSICSADFNEWVWKNASTLSPYSYVWTGEYEIFEFDLGSTFNYAEMAALIAPRPFMVERGHFDGVAPDETVAYEFAKVRHLYAAKLGIPDRCEIEWFVGPHTIHGEGTFRFLSRHLNWPPGQ